jgi:hypothetical protein
MRSESMAFVKKQSENRERTKTQVGGDKLNKLFINTLLNKDDLEKKRLASPEKLTIEETKRKSYYDLKINFPDMSKSYSEYQHIAKN